MDNPSEPPPPPAVPDQQDRRKNFRLRAIIDEFQSNFGETRKEVEFQLNRISELQAELEDLKRAWQKP